MSQFEPFKSMQAWGTLLSGIGTLVMGIGAVIAAWKADTVLDKIAEVKTTISEIRDSNKDLKNALVEIKKTDDSIFESVKSLVRLAAINLSKDINPSKQPQTAFSMERKNFELPSTSEQDLSYKDAGKEAEILNQNLKNDFSKETSDKRPWGLYLKDEKRKEIVEEYKNKKLNLEQLQEKVSEALDSTVLEELRQNRTR